MSAPKTAIRLTGNALRAVDEFRSTALRHLKQVQDLQEEYKVRAAALRAKNAQEARVAWAALVSPLGIDAEQTFEDGAWQLDVTYLDQCGCAFLCEYEREGAGSEVPTISSSPPTNSVN